MTCRLLLNLYDGNDVNFVGTKEFFKNKRHYDTQPSLPGLNFNLKTIFQFAANFIENQNAFPLVLAPKKRSVTVQYDSESPQQCNNGIITSMF